MHTIHFKTLKSHIKILNNGSYMFRSHLKRKKKVNIRLLSRMNNFLHLNLTPPLLVPPPCRGRGARVPQ